MNINIVRSYNRCIPKQRFIHPYILSIIKIVGVFASEKVRSIYFYHGAFIRAFWSEGPDIGTTIAQPHRQPHHYVYGFR